jgi:hypothetical protein
LRDKRIKVVDEERVHGVAGVFRPLHNVHVPMFRKLQHSLCVVWKEKWAGSLAAVRTISAPPHSRQPGSREQVELRGMKHSYAPFS